MSKTDKELIELAAKAVGIETNKARDGNQTYCYDRRDGVYKNWDPLSDDGDALRLAVDLKIRIGCVSKRKVWAKPTHCGKFFEGCGEFYQNKDSYEATRRAIVRAAAAIGEAME